MGNARGERNSKVGVALQIAAMVMLLCGPYLPLLARAASDHSQPGRCAMDHRLCGCSPERIASRTCCCFRSMKQSATSSKSRCCDLQANANEQGALDGDDHTPSAYPRLSSLPCGLDPQVISHATSELKYLRSTRTPLMTQRSAPHTPSAPGDNYRNPSLEPPVPPPKIFFFV